MCKVFCFLHQVEWTAHPTKPHKSAFCNTSDIPFSHLHAGNKPVRMADKANLPYTNAVLHEAMRMRTAVQTGSPRKTLCDCIIDKRQKAIIFLQFVQPSTRKVQSRDEFLKQVRDNRGSQQKITRTQEEDSILKTGNIHVDLHLWPLSDRFHLKWERRLQGEGRRLLSGCKVSISFQQMDITCQRELKCGQMWMPCTRMRHNGRILRSLIQLIFLMQRESLQGSLLPSRPLGVGEESVLERLWPKQNYWYDVQQDELALALPCLFLCFFFLCKTTPF